MSVFEPADEETDASNDEQTSLWNYGAEVTERSEDWLPRTGDCDCGGNDEFCFREDCIDWDELDARVERVKNISVGAQ